MFINVPRADADGAGLRRSRKGEAGLTGEGALLLVIATGVIALCAWLAWQYNVSTDAEAHAFAEQTVRRLLYDHDARYLATHLSPSAVRGYPPNQQRIVIYSLTNLGKPDSPVELKGSVGEGDQPGAHDPVAHYEARVFYPRAEAELYLDVGRHQGRWGIDLLSFGWQDRVPKPTP